jgi:hypothetical protein
VEAEKNKAIPRPLKKSKKLKNMSNGGIIDLT